MAVINAPSMHERLYVGAHGNLSLATASANLSKAAVGDEIHLLDIPIGIKTEGIRIISDGLGSGVKADIKLGDVTLAPDVDLSAKTSEVLLCEAYTKEKAILTAVTKGAEATGKLIVKIEYVAEGY